MKLLSTNEVCEILGISKATLYRWNNLNDLDSDSISTIINKKTDKMQAIKSLIDKEIEKRQTAKSLIDKEIEKRQIAKSLIDNKIEDPIVRDFPKPFRIGRTYKWSSEEIKNWLEKTRVR